jgi:hypothetical protein
MNGTDKLKGLPYPYREKDFYMSQRQLELACNLVEESWLPMNTELLTRIQTDVRSGAYETQRRQLIQDIKGDFSLFVYCIRKLGELIASDKGKGAKNLFPLFSDEDLRSEKLKEVILKCPPNLSCHSLQKMNALQAKRLQQAFISAATVETIAPNVNVDSDVGFTTAVFRQLGLTLIAWNYPHVFSRALKALTPQNSNLDAVLLRILGFAPLHLGASLAERWGMPEDLLATLRVQNRDVRPETPLIKLCQIGEALSRASDPEHYPSALADWDSASQAVKEHLGENGIQLIQERLSAVCKAYRDKMPDIFELRLDTTSSQKISISSHAQDRIKQNNYLKFCSPLLRMQVNEVYALMQDAQITRQALDKLMKDVFPCAGFDSGAVFMLEPYSQELVPILKFGRIRADRIQTVKISGPAIEPVSVAYQCTAPIKEDIIGVDGKALSYIVGGLGTTQRAGVLYLEVAERMETKPNFDPLLHFKAVRGCLMDCLGLS